MSVEGLFVHDGELWQLKHHHHAFSHHNKGRPVYIQVLFKIFSILQGEFLLVLSGCCSARENRVKVIHSFSA